MTDNQEFKNGLERFLNKVELKKQAFREAWMREHKKNPKHFPLDMPDGNEGLWYEFFYNFLLQEGDTL
ncbi:hypothetical protein Q9L42_020330 (plasmid) [Methylomarinum sp. Ch1-1]|uniref:Uncharacterized protein n=1 Tax=Methylomarinum roseum TaxID=3067653 RepID=A0AAU7P084_9GAMM|nr:hypothetical protein [Methylomarinum sp. Ch1-1]MDP4523259.1 hypothetical protein [Methylomarinum sp. Ch1-1]